MGKKKKQQTCETEDAPCDDGAGEIILEEHDQDTKACIDVELWDDCGNVHDARGEADAVLGNVSRQQNVRNAHVCVPHESSKHNQHHRSYNLG